MITTITILGWLAALGWCYLAFGHAHFWEPLLADPVKAPAAWPSVDIIIPARNEADMLPQSLPSLLQQDYPGDWRIILVDDHSQDGTGNIALDLSSLQPERLSVVSAPPLPEGWSGKVAAMSTGVEESRSHYILFTDADITHAPDSLRHLVARSLAYNFDLVSLMVRLRCDSFAEKLLVPAFVFFFTMLYPFRRACDPQSSMAAAAGGVMLLKRQALENIGGLARIKSALIDDCALAKAIKTNGGKNAGPGRIALTLTHDVSSLRPYPEIKDVWQMISRTAYTQLQYSPALLAGTLVGMLILYIIPLILLLSGNGSLSLTGFAVWSLMSALYMPTVLFYGQPALWAFTLPLAAMVYMGATFDSARLYHQGKGGQWKGRAQA